IWERAAASALLRSLAEALLFLSSIGSLAENEMAPHKVPREILWLNRIAQLLHQIILYKETDKQRCLVTPDWSSLPERARMFPIATQRPPGPIEPPHSCVS